MTLQFNELAIDGIKPDYGTYVYSAYVGDQNTAQAAYWHIKTWLKEQGIFPNIQLTRVISSLYVYTDTTGDFDTGTAVQDMLKLEVQMDSKKDAALFKLNLT
jgi:hypothetical protein